MRGNSEVQLGLHVASFPGPAQLFVACSTEKRGQPKAARRPGNKASLHARVLVTDRLSDNIESDLIS